MKPRYVIFEENGTVFEWEATRLEAYREGKRGYVHSPRTGNWYDLAYVSNRVHPDEVPDEVKLKALLLT